MTGLTIIFLVILVCFEIDFFAVLYCKEIAEWLKAKSEEIRARAENLREANPAYNAGYSTGYTDGKIDGMKIFASETDTSEPDTEIYRKEGSE